MKVIEKLAKKEDNREKRKRVKMERKDVVHEFALIYCKRARKRLLGEKEKEKKN